MEEYIYIDIDMKKYNNEKNINKKMYRDKYTYIYKSILEFALKYIYLYMRTIEKVHSIT